MAVANLLAAGRSAAAAAREASVGERTVRGWLCDEAFCREVEKIRAELWSRALARLAGALNRAVAAMVGCLADDDARVRLASARAIIADALAIRGSIDMEARLHALEQRAEGAASDGHGWRPGRPG
jgi:hypothetical protein